MAFCVFTTLEPPRPYVIFTHPPRDVWFDWATVVKCICITGYFTMPHLFPLIIMKEPEVVEAHSGPIMRICFNKTKSIFVTASKDNNAKAFLGFSLICRFRFYFLLFSWSKSIQQGSTIQRPSFAARNHYHHTDLMQLFMTMSKKLLKTYKTPAPVNHAVISPIFNHVLCAGGQEARDVALKVSSGNHVYWLCILLHTGFILNNILTYGYITSCHTSTLICRTTPGPPAPSACVSSSQLYHCIFTRTFPIRVCNRRLKMVILNWNFITWSTKTCSDWCEVTSVPSTPLPSTPTAAASPVAARTGSFVYTTSTQPTTA